MRGYVLSSAACGVSQIFPACGAPKFGVGPTPNLGRLYPCGSQNWDGRKKGGCRHNTLCPIPKIGRIWPAHVDSIISRPSTPIVFVNVWMHFKNDRTLPHQM